MLVFSIARTNPIPYATINNPSIIQFLVINVISLPKLFPIPAMLSLGRIPAHNSAHTDANSVFPVGKNGVFEQICVVWSPEKRNLNTGSSGQWRWYAIQTSAREIHAMVVPQPMGDVQSLRIIALFPSSGQILAQINTGGLERSRTLCKYSPESNSWTPLPPMITPRDLRSFAGAVMGDFLYVAGGQKQSNRICRKRPISKAERFDLRTCRWEALPDMHVGGSFAKGFALEGRFFVLHGLYIHDEVQRSAERFDPLTNQWSLLPHFLPPQVERFSVAVLHDELYMVEWSTLASSGTLLRYNKSSSLTAHHEWVLVGKVPSERRAYSDKQLLAVGNELWVIDRPWPKLPTSSVGIKSDSEGYDFCEIMYRSDQVSSTTPIWPIFEGPSFWPNHLENSTAQAQSVMYACKIEDKQVPPVWRTIPLFTL
eukprot:Gb_15893 [translate_table: standard]